jgi:branched-subunit amino acid ABC-type transport system permease component
MLLDAIATIILGGMMLIPFANVIVGAIIGAGLGGPPGAAVGIALAIAITYAETWIAERLGWRELRCRPHDSERLADAGNAVAASTMTAATNGRDPVTGPPTRRQKLRRPRDVSSPSVRTGSAHAWRRGSTR